MYIKFVFLTKHFSFQQRLLWQLNNYIFPIFMAPIVRETGFFIKSYDWLIQTIPKKMESDRSSQEKLSQRGIFAPLLSSQILVIGWKLIFEKKKINTNCHHYGWLYFIYCLRCLIFLVTPWWPVWAFCAQTPSTFQMKLLKIKIRDGHLNSFTLFISYSTKWSNTPKPFIGSCRRIVSVWSFCGVGA